MRGDAASNNDSYTYTNEFGNFTGDASRKTLTDTSGVDTINTTAVSSNVNLNLAPGSNNTVAGNTLTIANNTTIENAFTGDGNDVIIGNEADNTLKGYRGDDALDGKGGNDYIDGGSGDDTVKGGTGNDTLVGGAGKDEFVFDGANLGFDLITDGNSQDTLNLLAYDVSEFTSSPSASGDDLIFDFAQNGKITEKLWFKADPFKGIISGRGMARSPRHIQSTKRIKIFMINQSSSFQGEVILNSSF